MIKKQLEKVIENYDDTLDIRFKELEEAFGAISEEIDEVVPVINKSIKNSIEEPEIKVEVSHNFQLRQIVENPITFDLLRNGDFDLFDDGFIGRRYGKLAVCKTIKLTLTKIVHAGFTGNPFRVTGSVIDISFFMSVDGHGFVLATAPRFEYLPHKFEWLFGGDFVVLMEDFSEIVKVKNKDKKRPLDFSVNISAIVHVCIRLLLLIGRSSEDQTDLTRSFVADAAAYVNSEMRGIDDDFCIQDDQP